MSSSDAIISIDIGVQNLAFCIFRPPVFPATMPSILDWQVIQLLNIDQPPNTQPTPLCSETLKNGKPCTRPACWTHPTLARVYCNRHAKQTAVNESLLFSRTHGPTALTRWSKEKLSHVISEDTSFPPPKKNASKSVWVQYVSRIYEGRVFTEIAPEMPRIDATSNQAIIQMGKNIKRFFDAHPVIPHIRAVLIENQIAPHMTSVVSQQRIMGTTRMKMIQGLIMEYFIVRGADSIQIEFMSSTHKLNQFLPTSPYAALWTPYFPDGLPLLSTTGLSDGAKYRAHKKQASIITAHLLSHTFEPDLDPGWNTWISKRQQSTKKDDLDDAFLQGVAFFAHHK